MTIYEKDFEKPIKGIESAIREAIRDVDFSKHKRKKKVRRSWMSIELNREMKESLHEGLIRSGLKYDIPKMLHDLKEGNIIVPEFHDKTMSYCDPPSWRHQFVASSEDGKYHVLVTMERCLWDLEIAFEIEVEE